MQRKILVTGGAGYVGSHTCKLLARHGMIPIVYDNLSRGSRDLVRWGAFEQGSLAETQRLAAVMRKHGTTGVLHFAAFAYVGESVHHPEIYEQNNVRGSRALLDAMLAVGVRNLVFSSSCAVYGHPSGPLLREDDPRKPINPYGQTKLAVERMLADHDRDHGLRSVSLRYFNAAGADPEIETGESHDPEPHLIPRLLEVGRGARAHIEVFGTDWATEDGTAVRDYVHVMDLAEAHLQALAYLEKGGATTAVNLGTGRGTSVLQLIAAVQAVTGAPIPWRAAPRRPGDPPILVADPAMGTKLLGWQPRFVEMATTVEHAWRWALRKR